MTWHIIVMSVLLSLVANEFGDVSPWLARRLVRWSARLRYRHDPARLAIRVEELEEVIQNAPGKLLKLVCASGFAASAVTYRARRSMALHLVDGRRRLTAIGDSIRKVFASSATPDLGRLTDLLAAAMRDQWTAAATDHRLGLPVRWRLSTHAVAGTVAVATSTWTHLAPFEPLPGLTRDTASQLRRGTHHDLHRVYGGPGSGRLLLIGDPCTGKSSAAILLLLDALRFRDQATPADRRCIPVPVLFTMADWDPATTPIEDWLRSKISDVPLFRGRRGARAATWLLHAGRISVFLDGLDEMPLQKQSLALQALGEQATFRLVLLTRIKELTAAAQRHPLTGAVVVELQPLTPTDVADYLLSSLPDPAPPAWQRVVTTLTTQPDSPLAQALTIRLAACLLHHTYSSDDPVDELCDTNRFPHPDAINSHLLTQAINASNDS